MLLLNRHNVVNPISTIHKAIMYFMIIKIVKNENSAFDVYKNKRYDSAYSADLQKALTTERSNNSILTWVNFLTGKQKNV